MKQDDSSNTVQVHKSVYSSPIYEVEMWFANEQDFEKSDEDYLHQFNSDGMAYCDMWENRIGLFRTYKNALSYYEMIAEDSDVPVMFIREKPLNCLMNKDDYIKEWIFRYGLLADESIVRNYDERDYPFHGRPTEMIRHKRGDIVQVYDNGTWHWGIVYAVPPSVEIVAEKESRWRADKNLSERFIHLDWSDDSYIILTNAKDYMASHEHIVSHHVIAPTEEVPDIVRKTLQKGLQSVLEDEMT